MVIKPRLKGSLALTAHPAGCEEFVKRQIDYVKKSDKYSGPKKVLIIGSSSGYGLASRISLAFGAGADTIGVAFEKGVEGKRVGTAGWWNTVAFTEEVRKEGLIAKNFMGVDNFSMGIVGLIMMIFGFVAIEPIISVILSIMTVGVNFLINAKLLPLTALFVQPGQVLFLNNAINHGIMTPIAIEQAAKFGKSVIFLVEANCGCWFGITLAFMFFGKGMAKKSAPAAALIMFFGGIGEVVFPYVLSKPKTLLGAILGNMASLFILTTFNGGTVAAVSPGSFLALVAMTPKGSFIVNIASYFVGAAVAMLVASFFLMRDKTEEYETEAALNTEGVGEPADTLEIITPSGNIENIIFACDAGMGSSVMGVSVMKNMLKKAMIYKNVEHVSVAEIPEKADLIVTTKSLEGRVRDVIKKYNKDIPVFAVDNLMNNAEYEKIIEYLKTLS